MNIERHIEFFVIAADKFEANLQYLSQLDSALGDGDHGASMLKGFSLAKEKIVQQRYNDVGALWVDAGGVIMKKIGGTCGPLFATILMKGGMLAKGVSDTDTAKLAAMIVAGSEGVRALGKATPGDKTMVDALAPAADALAAHENAPLVNALEMALRAARDGAQATRDMLAAKGRGRYQNENSRGHIDPGAVSVCIILEALLEAAAK